MGAFLLGVLALGLAYFIISPRLPTVAQIRELRMQVPLQVFTADGKLIATFGETRRTPIVIEKIPRRVIDAFIATEDARFYQHPGVDWRGTLRAVYLLATPHDGRVPGGSTITQQVAKNFFLSSEYRLSRKIAEMFLAFRLEKELSKDEILELYLNKIFFGFRSYGVVAAADFYYGKSLEQLTLGEIAMLAAIPKFPSSGNPLINPDRAMIRRKYVLDRMLENNFISSSEHAEAMQEANVASPHEAQVEVDAEYVAEMVRLDTIEKLGSDALVSGYKAYTSIDSRLQEAANAAVRQGLIGYDQRHGYRGVEAHIEFDLNADKGLLKTKLANYRSVAGLIPALVIKVDQEATVLLADGTEVVLALSGFRWARKFISITNRGAIPTRISDVVKSGDVIRIRKDREGNWELGQIPDAQSSMVAIDPEDGRLLALVGGFHYNSSKFNRAIQANRQPGSSFKPFIYSAAFDRGFTPATIVNDAPLVLPDPTAKDGFWRPQNDNGKFYGPMRVREALVASRNLVSVRMLDAIGVRYARDYIKNFGFSLDSLSQNLSMALGSNSLSPMEMARGYAVFANGGYRIDPYFITKINDRDGKMVFETKPSIACKNCEGRSGFQNTASPTGGSAEDLGMLLGTISEKPINSPAQEIKKQIKNPLGLPLAERAVDPRTAFLVTSMMKDVIKRGTAKNALVLNRDDIAGKTGTTNEHRDAWFCGFHPRVVATAWMGRDDFKTLGRGEFAAQTALPIWIGFMKVALDGVEKVEEMPPDGITKARINAGSGQLTNSEAGVEEYFKVEDISRLSSVGYSDKESSDAEERALDVF